MDPVEVGLKVTELVTSRNHWQKTTLYLFFFILLFVTFFFSTYQNVEKRLQEIKEEQKEQKTLLENFYKEKDQNEKKYLLRYRI